MIFSVSAVIVSNVHSDPWIFFLTHDKLTTSRALNKAPDLTIEIQSWMLYLLGGETLSNQYSRPVAVVSETFCPCRERCRYLICFLFRSSGEIFFLLLDDLLCSRRPVVKGLALLFRRWYRVDASTTQTLLFILSKSFLIHYQAKLCCH